MAGHVVGKLQRTRTPAAPRRRRGLLALAAVAAFAGSALIAAPAAHASAGQTVTPINGTTVTASTLVNALVGTGVGGVSNATFTGNNAAAGLFSGMGAVGFADGIVLSTGTAANTPGPNKSNQTSTAFNGPGDTDLNAIVTPRTTEDAAVLEFDFVPTSSTIRFQYVFSSEEYNEFVNSQFNDVFAFFVNGKNCALVPGTSQPVAVNTINGGNPFGTGATNPSLYRNNSISDPGPATIDTEMDGLTTVLNCDATVNANVTNHMKLAIADTSDADLDSAVFLRTASLIANVAPACQSQTITVQPNTPTSITLTATDENGDLLTYSIVTQPTHGTLTGTPPTMTYTPAAGFSGSDSFTFSASDGQLSCTGNGTINLNVLPTTTTSTTVVPVAVTPRFTG